MIMCLLQKSCVVSQRGFRSLAIRNMIKYSLGLVVNMGGNDVSNGIAELYF